MEKSQKVGFNVEVELLRLLESSDVRCSVCPDLIDSVELERTVNNLNKELSVSREAEEALRAQLEELASNKVDDLMKQVRSANIF